MSSGALTGLLCVMGGFIFVGTIIGAVFLRAAIALYNKLAGGPDSESAVPEPSFGRTILILFLTSVVNAIASAALTVAIGSGAGAAGIRGNQLNVPAQVGGFVLSLFVLSGALSVLLPTTFPRAVMVSLCYLITVVAVVAGIAVFAWLVFGVLAK